MSEYAKQNGKREYSSTLIKLWFNFCTCPTHIQDEQTRYVEKGRFFERTQCNKCDIPGEKILDTDLPTYIEKRWNKSPA